MAHYEYTALYRTLGVDLPNGTDEIRLINDANNRFSVFLTSKPDTRVVHVDRRAALSLLMLQGLVGQATGQDLEVALPEQIGAIRGERARRYGNGPYLVLHGEGEVEPLGTRPASTRDYEAFAVSLGGVRSSEVRHIWADCRDVAMAGLALACGKTVQADWLGDGTVFYSNGAKPHYIFNLEGGTARAVVSSPLSDTQVVDTQRWYAELTAHPTLNRVSKLLVASMRFQDDRLRSFMSAWSALEILVNKIFAEYSELFFVELRAGGHPEVRARYVDRISEVMQGKYRLNDKFGIIAAYLVPTDADTDFSEFDELKKQRDLLAHGQDVADSELRVHVAQQLTQKYLQRHLSRI